MADEEQLQRPDPLDTRWLREMLAKLQGKYAERIKFEPGDLVTWKSPHLRNKRRPAEGAVGIVIEHRDEPFFDDESRASSPYWREPLDLRVGILDEDNDFLMYWFDSRRFTHAELNI